MKKMWLAAVVVVVALGCGGSGQVADTGSDDATPEPEITTMDFEAGSTGADEGSATMDFEDGTAPDADGGDTPDGTSPSGS